MSTKVPNKLTLAAVAQVKGEWAKDFFDKKFKPQPRRLFADYYSPQDEAILQSIGLTEDDAEEHEDSTYTRESVALSLIDLDQSLTQQDRRDLTKFFVREQTMHSFMKNGENVNSPAVVLRRRDDGSYAVGDGRHRLIWSLALGCEQCHAWVVTCSDAEWEKLRTEFNDYNGAQRTEEERLYAAFRLYQQGGHGGKKALCRQKGLSLTKFEEFLRQREAYSKAEKVGLKVVPGTPPAVVEKAVLLQEEKGILPATAQRLIDAVAPAETAGGKIPKSTLTPLLELDEDEEITDEKVENLANKLAKEAKKPNHRGPGKSYRTKITEVLTSLSQWITKGSPAELGINDREAVDLRKKVTNLLVWLGNDENIEK